MIQSVKKPSEIYTGSTNDLKSRILQHNQGKVFSTKRYMPWRFVYYEAYLSEKDARIREQKFKRHGKSNIELKKRLRYSLSFFRKKKGESKGLPLTFLKKKGEGFTILEVMIAIFVVTIGVLAAYTVTQQIISYTHRSASRLTAIYLGKEGIEIVRNIRDTNWLESVPSWKDGLINCTTGCEAGYNDTPPFYSYDDNHYLNLETASGFYGYNPGDQTNFKRKITIDDTTDLKGDDILKVTVEVEWEYKGEDYGPVTAQENLYNWYPE